MLPIAHGQHAFITVELFNMIEVDDVLPVHPEKGLNYMEYLIQHLNLIRHISASPPGQILYSMVELQIKFKRCMKTINLSIKFIVNNIFC